MYRLSRSNFLSLSLSKLVYRIAGALLAAVCTTAATGTAWALEGDVTAALSPPAVEVAKDLNLLPAVQELLDAEKSEGKDSLQALRVREKLVESVLMASLEIRSSTSRIDAEISSTNETRDILADSRERKGQNADIVNFMSGGTTTILTNALTEFTQNPSKGGVVGGGAAGVLGGALQIGISAISVKINRGERRSSGIKPNMLAPLFGYTGADTQFNEGVWAFLNDPYPLATNPQQTRREHLVHQWMRIGRIAPLSTPRGQRQIGLLTGMIPQDRAITIDLLEDRALMLSDLRAAISQMDIEMLEIMRWVKTL
jgi:hypothetical protein